MSGGGGHCLVEEKNIPVAPFKPSQAVDRKQFSIFVLLFPACVIPFLYRDKKYIFKETDFFPPASKLTIILATH